jgi:nitroreductase
VHRDAVGGRRIVDVFEVLATRRTASAFAPDTLNRDELAKLIDAATWAPNHRNTEPWRFIVVAGGERRTMGDHIARWMAAPPEGEPRTPAQIESVCKKLMRSPAIIVVVQHDRPESPVRDLEDYAACCCATQNLLLAARAEGFATKWSTGELVDLAPAREYLDLGERDRIVGYVYIGRPGAGEEPKQPERQPAIVSWRGL